MRRLAALIMLTLLGACSTVDDLTPVMSSSSPMVAVRAPRFEDSKPHEWDSGAPWNYAIHGTDVSKYQTAVDWPAAKASGISFAFIKATEGGDRFDEYFNEHWARTKASAIPRAAYHFFYFCTPAATQARWFIANVPKDRSAMPPVLDMEW
ncbi:glycoside hydrolase, partial [Mesorhizobium sp. USDA-HM6]